MDKISLVIPMYNEEASFPFLIKELNKLFVSMKNQKFEVIMVDNCSEDNTLSLIKKQCSEDNRFLYISFSRNFGKEASMYAGLKASSGDYVTIMDADLEDPPRLVKEMYNIIKNEDYDSVSSYREYNKNVNRIRIRLAKAFYSIINKISDLNLKSGARDFRLMSRQMVDAIISMSEKDRFSKGLFAWVGFKVKWISYVSEKRVAGNTKLPTGSAFKYALSAIVGFSFFPLYIPFLLMFLFFLLTLGYFIFFFSFEKIDLLFSMFLLFLSFLFLVLGINNIYISKIMIEVRNRPLYIVKEKTKSLEI